jgi:hypothetical protein
MEPTPFARAASGAIIEGMRLIRQGMENTPRFDPATSEALPRAHDGCG